MFKFVVFVVCAAVQAKVSQAQGAQQPNYAGQGMTQAQMWDPVSWATPYYAAASDAWAKYYKNAQDISNQLYQQWDKSGASNIFDMGLGMAQQAASQAQKLADEAQKYAQQYGQAAASQAQQYAQQAQQYGQVAVDQAQKLAGEAQKYAQQYSQAAVDQAQKYGQAAAYQAQQVLKQLPVN